MVCFTCNTIFRPRYFWLVYHWCISPDNCTTIENHPPEASSQPPLMVWLFSSWATFQREVLSLYHEYLEFNIHNNQLGPSIQTCSFSFSHPFIIAPSALYSWSSQTSRQPSLMITSLTILLVSLNNFYHQTIKVIKWWMSEYICKTRNRHITTLF